MNICITLITSGGAVKRRTGNHHPNLWDDNFIQSLAQTYQPPSNVERAETLIAEIKDMFNSVATADITSSPQDLLDCLSIVDSVERLGIDRHFQKEIKKTLDYVYRHWSEKGIGRGKDSPYTDLNTTAMGLRILRLHRYSISSDVLDPFRGKDGHFLYTTGESDEVTKIILNLYRASFIAFPGEKIMDEAKAFATTYLKQALQKIENSSLSREIELNLQYGWYTNLPRLEARNYIDIYEQDTSWAEKTINEMPNMRNKKLLDLAKLDFNMMQYLQQQELQTLSRWWTGSDLSKLTFARHRHVEFYFLAAGICADPKHSACRLGFSKSCAILTCLDDIYDTYGTLDELNLFTEVIKRWNLSGTDCLPEYMKIAFMALYEAVSEMAREAEKTQGRDTLDYARKAWEANIDACMEEAKWLADGYIPTLSEYLETAKASSGSRTVALQPLLTLDALLPETILPKIDYPSRFNELSCLCLRLKGDSRNFKAEAARGEIASCVTCYMRDHPGSTEEEALNYINVLLEECLKELNLEYLKSDDGVPTLSKNYAYDLCRGEQLFYKERDGVSISSEDIKSQVTKLLMDSVTI